MLEHKTRVAAIEFGRDGHVFVKLQKERWDGDELVSEEPHRMTVAPDQTVADVIAANNAHLVGFLGYPAVGDDDVKKIADMVAAHEPQRAEGRNRIAAAAAKPGAPSVRG